MSGLSTKPVWLGRRLWAASGVVYAYQVLLRLWLPE